MQKKTLFIRNTYIYNKYIFCKIKKKQKTCRGHICVFAQHVIVQVCKYVRAYGARMLFLIIEAGNANTLQHLNL